MGWRAFSMGSSLGKVGSAGGVIVADEDYDEAARITLERATAVAPFAITCGVSGWLVHTRFFESEAQATSQFEAMKVALARMTQAAGQSNDPSLTGRLAQEFVEAFP
jgi:hypothetical protein